MRLRRLAAGCCVAVVAGACTAPWARQPARHAAPRPTPAPRMQFVLDDVPVAGATTATSRSHLRLVFGAPLRAGTVTLTVDGAPAPAEALAWAADSSGADVSLAALVPYRPTRLGVQAPRPVSAPGDLQVTMLATLPSNGSSGVAPGTRPATPLEIVVENSGPARPQAGLQDADVVYEYLSEYATTRMTAIYFGHVPSLVGPVRSCRMVNPYLAYAYAGVVMCSGVSDGTAHYMFGAGPDARPVPGLLESDDPGRHFFRVANRVIPHTVFTSGDRAERLRTEGAQAPGDYVVDSSPDAAAAGQPADPPAVPLHSVGYSYDAGSRQYLRSDHGRPFTDQVSGAQVHARTVVLLHVPFHDGGWVEDENGGAHSVWYDMLGSGPAEVYADGTLVHATWHMGAAPGQPYYENHTPVWFSDDSGRVLRLGTGLTWIHVLGNGQERCPDSPSAC